jgi:hypothetical protein
MEKDEVMRRKQGKEGAILGKRRESMHSSK